MSSVLPTTETEINFFISAFEACTLPNEHWTHAAHIYTAACYVHSFGEAYAIDRMRKCIQAYNLTVAGKNTPTSGYHETVTAFWIKLIDSALAMWSPIGRADFATRAVTEFSPLRTVFANHYDFDILASPEARATWIEPLRAISVNSLEPPQPQC